MATVYSWYFNSGTKSNGMYGLEEFAGYDQPKVCWSNKIVVVACISYYLFLLSSIINNNSSHRHRILLRVS